MNVVDCSFQAHCLFLIPINPNLNLTRGCIRVTKLIWTFLFTGGGLLRTLVLRPPVMYGELDPFYVPAALDAAQHNNGVLRRIGDGSSRTQNAYVGNVAWGHVIAVEALKDLPVVRGECFHMTDDTPILNTFEFMNYFLDAKGYHLSTSSLSYRPIYYSVRVAEGIKWLLKPIVRSAFNIPTSSPGLHYINSTYTFSGRKARKLLKYEPLYTFTQSLERSINYYNTIWKYKWYINIKISLYCSLAHFTNMD